MINIAQLAEYFENSLNENVNSGVLAPTGIMFNIFTDTGKYVKAERENNDITRNINGLYTVSSNEIQNTSGTETGGLTIATISSRIEFLIPCLDDENDIYTTTVDYETGTSTKELIQHGNSAYIQSIRNLFSKICAKTYQYQQDDNGTSYNITVTYTVAVSGNREQLPETGDCFTFLIYANYSIVENGSNSKEWKLYIDGVLIPYLSMTPRRIPTSESSVFNYGLSTKNIPTSTTLGISIESPMLYDDYFSGILREYLLTGESDIHIIELKAHGNTADKGYLAYIYELDTTASGALNVGATVTFAEAVPLYGTYSIPSAYYVYSVKLTNSTSSSATVDLFDEITLEKNVKQGVSMPLNNINSNKLSFIYSTENECEFTMYQNGIILSLVELPLTGDLYTLTLIRGKNG